MAQWSRVPIWVLGALIVLEAVSGLDVFLPAIRGAAVSSLATTSLCSKLDWIVLLGILLVAAILTVKIACVQQRKLDQLIAR